jgi:S-DNA-T family DNA segregation ATPase FtsK/SpoIIIE
VALVRRAWELMEYRYRLMESGEASPRDFEPLVVFLDEFAEFRANLLEWYPSVKENKGSRTPPTLNEVASLARKGRTARVHLVLATQRPDSAFLGGEMRDNFGQRLSMGRLSPQGAMMVWENASIGVSLPRFCIGRAMAMGDAGYPVEVQCYRFPDIEAPEDSEDHARVTALRPATSRHPRLLIVPPPEMDASGQPLPVTRATGQPGPSFAAYARASWDLASNRADLDPLAARPARDDVDRRALSSPLASLGIEDTQFDSRTRHLRVVEAAADSAVSTVDDADTDAEAFVDGSPVEDDYAGYAEPVFSTPTGVVVGDLIEVDPGSGVWVVVDEHPEDDVLDPGMVVLSWRGDGDEAGTVSLPDDLSIHIRRPEEYVA